uniref:Ecto-NOX disulfide-thiol exchanger 1 n=1 Tax=Tetraodon nigroviridis TaxID=99883 RepID=H3DPY9_TETNG
AAADGAGGVSAEQNHLTVPVGEHGAWAAAMNHLVLPVGVGGQQLLPDSLCLQRFQPSLGLLTPVSPMMAGISLAPPPPVKEIIHCSSCTLFPQNPNLPPPSTRERPPGCKTVFVGGLPENATEELIREVFERCGEIAAIRKSKKNFCHIRFSEEPTVDKALFLSGYRMRIGSSTDKKDTGKIHVDFAQARDDLYEWECRQRLLAHYSEHEAALLADRLRDDQQFSGAAGVLFAWIDRGEVNRRTSNHFYSMIQSANSHVRRLMVEKAQEEEEMERARDAYRSALLAVLTQLEHISSVFAASSRQKAWDHFSKAQRKNIDMWRKQCEELRNAYSEEVTGIRREEEMEMSEDDAEESPCKRTRTVCAAAGGCEQTLREENDSLRWQLDSYKNEVEQLRNSQPDQEQPLSPDVQIQLLQQSLHSMQQQVLSLQDKLRNKEADVEQVKEEHRCLEGQMTVLQAKLKQQCPLTSNTCCYMKEYPCIGGRVPCLYHSRERRAEATVASEKEAVLLGIISTFLHVHPFGANLEYLWSYIQRLDSQVSAADLERLMVRLPTMFRQELSGVGANLEKRWSFCGFDSLSSA